MSLVRLVYYSAVIGGWAAFLSWLAAELLVLRGSSAGVLKVTIVGGFVGSAVGAGLNVVAGMANGQWFQLAKRTLPGFLAGGIGGALGGLMGDLLYSSVGAPRAFGWMIMGLGIGVVEGLYERAPSKVRNGLIGCGLGGLAGGFLFEPIFALVNSASGMSSRATAFVILGMCIGAFIGLTQVVLKEAWLTVLDGYRVGRQLILSQPVTVLGRAEHLPLPFLGESNRALELEHARITRQPGGSFLIQDNGTQLGTFVKNQRITRSVTLHNGDVIKLGPNSVRFNERSGNGSSDSAALAPRATAIVTPPPPPPTMKGVATTPVNPNAEPRTLKNAPTPVSRPSSGTSGSPSITPPARPANSAPPVRVPPPKPPCTIPKPPLPGSSSGGQRPGGPPPPTPGRIG